MNILFIGGGNMASALIGGLIGQGWSAGHVCVVEIAEDARRALSQRYGVAVGAQPPQPIPGDAVVLLAIKPQQMRQAAQALRPHLAGQLVVTIAAGIRTRDLSRWLGGHQRLVRVMPNTPALLRAGVSALFAMAGVDAPDRQCAESILAAVGPTLWVEREELMDAVTAVSGSGPAYVFYFMEALMQAGRELGLSEAAARVLTLETFHGAALLARQGDEPPAVLRERVTSKGGTTERALRVLEEQGVRERLVDAVKQAAARSRELGDELGGSD
jgi:pyrroline-5-carboxylate reductase